MKEGTKEELVMTEEKKKYARVVIEDEILDKMEDEILDKMEDEILDKMEDEILDKMEDAIRSFVSDHWGIDDIEIHERPYNS